MDITRTTRLSALLRHSHLREVLDGFELPLDSAASERWTLADACRVAGIDVDDVVVELELAESEAEFDDDEDDDDDDEWAFAG
jgi:hypothetical protein